MDPRHHDMLQLMQALEAELRARRLWSDAAPDAAAMASVMPFMYDTLELQQWLQWVFLPRTRALIEAGGRLPGNCHIHPLAEHEFTQRQELDSYRLLELIRDIDTLMNRR
jgi:uncharacterized protein YqcC (DUF446 family)